MAIYVQCLYHIVIATHQHEPVLSKARREELYRCIWGTIKERKGHLHRIGGVDNHVHILTSVHPAVAVGELVKAIKVASAEWIVGQKVFPQFTQWQEGYAALTCSWEDKEMLVEAIKHQEEHHAEVSFREEFEEMLEGAGLKLAEGDTVWAAAEAEDETD
jgi:REP element-mobilizing transposase RayT